MVVPMCVSIPEEVDEYEYFPELRMSLTHQPDREDDKESRSGNQEFLRHALEEAIRATGAGLYFACRNALCNQYFCFS